MLLPARPKRAAFSVEALYRQYGDMVLGRCMTLLRNEADAQEACQDIFLGITRRGWRFRGESSPSTYLYRITTNHCLNTLRALGRRREESDADLAATPAPGSKLDRVELRDLLKHLLDGVDTKTRECVVYRYVDGMTNQETGDMLNISEAAVRKRLAKFQKRVQPRVRALLEE